FSWQTSHGKEICYSLKCLDRKIFYEKLVIDGEIKLERNEDGKCSIYFEKIDQVIEIQLPAKSLCCVVRRDKMQHPWFEHLHEWADSTLHYRFGSVFGKNIGLLIRPEDEHQNSLNDIEIDLKKTDRVVELFRKGYEHFGDIFVSNIIKSMEKISYKLTDINIDYSPNLKFKNPIDPPPAVLRVKEADLKCFTYQADMSQGMFRALSLIIQLNLLKLQGAGTCIIIDDIGEGLDYDRSTELIRLLIEDVEKTSIQLIMSTNGRFVMNNVSLKYWSVIQRKGNKSKVFNYSNAKETFEEFIFTGLSNFDFLCTDFYCKAFDDE
ncbi:MAG: AAA family ATPase, partial [Lentisphaeraceae bacterium]|nr:AAA family ATPase [Lentisphaeraceae bacterium]